MEIAKKARIFFNGEVQAKQSEPNPSLASEAQYDEVMW
jgi:hypothetical protein